LLVSRKKRGKQKRRGFSPVLPCSSLPSSFLLSLGFFSFSLVRRKEKKRGFSRHFLTPFSCGSYLVLLEKKKRVGSWADPCLSKAGGASLRNASGVGGRREKDKRAHWPLGVLPELLGGGRPKEKKEKGKERRRRKGKGKQKKKTEKISRMPLPLFPSPSFF
jgi:hypothetical protein